MLDEIHHGVEFVNALQENFNRFLHIVSAVVHDILDFRFRQFSVDFERNIGFLDAVSHKPFKGFQTPVGVQHHIVVQKGNFAEHRRILPPRLFLLDDEVIDLLRVKTAKDAFQDVLVIMTIVEACPNFVFVRFVQGFQSFGIVHNDMFLSVLHIENDNQPIVFEHFEVIKKHCFTFLSKRFGGEMEHPTPCLSAV